MRWLLRLLGPVLTGLLTVLAMPPVGWWPLAWIALAPLLVASRGQRFIVGFLFGMLAGGVIAGLSISGVFYADHSTSGEPMWIELGSVVFGTVMGTVAAISTEIRKSSLRAWIALASFAVLFEAATIRVVPVSVALSQSDVAAMRMVASAAGMWGVAFLLWLANLLLAECWLAKRAPKVAWQVAAIGGLGIAGFLWNRAQGGEKAIHIAVVQSEADDARDLVRLSGADPAALAVWPEFGGLLSAPGGNAAKLRQISRLPTSPSFVTTYQDDGRPLPRNVAVLFSRGGESDHYAKRLLFGGERQMHQPGTQPVAVPWQGIEVGLNVCFDSCSPELIRDTARLDRVQLVALPTIDPPSPHHWIAAMHAAFTPFRAAEEGVPIARADGFAYSEVADASGNVVLRLPPGERGASTGLRADRRWTFYRLAGDWMLVFCGAAIVFAAAKSLRERATPGSVSTEPRLPETARTPEEPPSRG